MPSATLGTVGNDLVEETSQSALQVITPTNSGTSHSLIAMPAGEQLRLGGNMATLAGKAVVAATTDGVIAVNLRNDSEMSVKLPTYECANASIPPALGDASTLPSNSTTCQSSPVSLTADATGNLWMVTSGPDGAIKEVPANAFTSLTG